MIEIIGPADEVGAVMTLLDEMQKNNMKEINYKVITNFRRKNIEFDYKMTREDKNEDNEHQQLDNSIGIIEVPKPHHKHRKLEYGNTGVVSSLSDLTLGTNTINGGYTDR